MPWSDDELVALADAWCTTSQDETRGTDQKGDAYWCRIQAKLAETLGQPEDYRSTDSITSKWTQMKAKLTKFNGIYMRLARNPPSGWNELKLLDEAHILYKAENNNNVFKLKRVWDRVRNERKWLELPSTTSRSSGSKRSFVDIDNSMGSDAHVNVNLNEETSSIPLDDDIDEDDASLHSRPQRGRDKAKRIQKFGDMNEAKARHREKIEKSIDAHLTSVEEKKARRNELQAEQQELINQQKIINHLAIMTTGGVDDEDVEIVREAKKESRSWLKNWFKK